MESVVLLAYVGGAIGCLILLLVPLFVLLRLDALVKVNHQILKTLQEMQYNEATYFEEVLNKN